MSTPHARRRVRRPPELPLDRVTLTEAYTEILRMPKSTFMARYRSSADSAAFAHWVRELDIRELRANGRTICVHCSRERVEAHADSIRANGLGRLALEPSERARRLPMLGGQSGGASSHALESDP